MLEGFAELRGHAGGRLYNMLLADKVIFKKCIYQKESSVLKKQNMLLN